MQLEHIALRAGEELGISLVLGMAAAPAASEELSAAELRKAAAMPRWRAAEWLRGRAALGQALRRLNCDWKPPRTRNARLSLTHGGNLSIAAATADDDVVGLGVDFECGPGPRPEATRFFLSAAEQSWLDRREPERSLARRRLWTVKEALYKADPGRGDCAWADYRLASPGEAASTASVAGRPGARRIAYASFEFLDGTISIACYRTEAKNERAYR